MAMQVKTAQQLHKISDILQRYLQYNGICILLIKIKYRNDPIRRTHPLYALITAILFMPHCVEFRLPNL